MDFSLLATPLTKSLFANWAEDCSAILGFPDSIAKLFGMTSIIALLLQFLNVNADKGYSFKEQEDSFMRHKSFLMTIVFHTICVTVIHIHRQLPEMFQMQ